MIGRAYDQPKWEVFHQYRATTEQLTERIAHEIRRLIEVEEQRSFSEYDYSTASPDGAANFVQQSPLAAYPVVENIPGVVGYFQVDSQGRLSSPVAPEGGDNDSEYGVGEDEYLERIAWHKHLREILNAPELELTTPTRNRRAQVDRRKRSADVVSMEAFGRRDESKKVNVFDRLSKSFESSLEKPLTDYPTVSELQLDSRFEAESRAQAPSTQVSQARPQIFAKRESRKDQVPVYELADEAIAISPSQNEAENDADLAEQPLGTSLANLAPGTYAKSRIARAFF